MRVAGALPRAGRRAYTARMTTVTMVYEGSVVSAAAEPADENLWLAPAALYAGTGMELTAAGFCRGSICIPIPPERRAEFVRGDGGLNVAALARHRGQAVVHDDERRVWAFGAPPEARAANRPSLEAPEFTLPDLDGRLHSLSDARGRKAVLIAWASW